MKTAITIVRDLISESPHTMRCSAEASHQINVWDAECLCDEESIHGRLRRVLSYITDEQGSLLNQCHSAISKLSVDRRSGSIPEYETLVCRLEEVIGELGVMLKKPKTVVLCGSTRFIDAFREANKSETLAGKIVLSCGYFGHSGDGDPDNAVRTRLNNLHRFKIEMADEVLVLDVDNYIGVTTRTEIEYAESLGKPIRYSSKEINRV